jgi:CDGSH-type Zn-finger protein/mannose-6-phosphate isomerase-like protein (cupin superfamily)
MSEVKPIVAHRKGFYYRVKAGKRYFWCRCGRSKAQPFCDGSHKGTPFTPLEYVARQDEEVIFCGCKHTGTAPFCDGSHSNLPGGYRLDDPESEANRQFGTVCAAAEPIVPLDGGCYVYSTTRAALKVREGLSYATVVSPATGALHQSQFYAIVERGASPIISADGRHTILFVAAGRGEIEICGRRFSVDPRTGVYVAPRECYRVHAAEPITLFISNGPGSEDLAWRQLMSADFEAAYPQRRAVLDASRRHHLAERDYQLLVNREQGSATMTQFIGRIPPSKAEPHRHLYEEALIFLSGSGVVWAEHTKTAIGAGDVLFLPRKQLHSVQCTSNQGFEVVGVICPGDNPAINY